MQTKLFLVCANGVVSKEFSQLDESLHTLIGAIIADAKTIQNIASTIGFILAVKPAPPATL